MQHFLPKKIFDLYYGLPGTAKSESAARVAEQAIRENPGKIARIVVGDGSAMTYEHLVEAGKAELCDFAYRPWPLDTLQRLAEGWFPKGGDPNGPLEKPDERLLNTCIYIFEGLSVGGAYIMGSIKGGLAQLSGDGQKIGQDSPIRIVQGDVDPKTGKLASGPGSTFGGNPPAHYNVAQRALVDCVQRSKGLPCHVIWTAHEATNDPEKDILTKELLVGPEVAGKALTANIQRIFNHTLHHQTVGKRVQTKDEHTEKAVTELDLDYRIYTRDHFAASGNITTRYKACTRGADGVRMYFTSERPGMGVLEFYREFAEIRKMKADQLG